MTRSQFTRIGFVGTALALIATAVTNKTAEAEIFPWYLTPRNLACWAVGCPSAGGAIKCADVRMEAADKLIGSASVTYYCYLSDHSQTDRPEDEM